MDVVLRHARISTPPHGDAQEPPGQVPVADGDRARAVARTAGRLYRELCDHPMVRWCYSHCKAKSRNRGKAMAATRLPRPRFAPGRLRSRKGLGWFNSSDLRGDAPVHHLAPGGHAGQLWLLQHLGIHRASPAAEHLRAAPTFRLRASIAAPDTYHGRGRCDVYLLDLARRNLKIRAFVACSSRRDRYAGALPRWRNAKTARRHLCERGKSRSASAARAQHRRYHGVALNVDMDLVLPRDRPCGYPAWR